MNDPREWLKSPRNKAIFLLILALSAFMVTVWPVWYVDSGISDLKTAAEIETSNRQTVLQALGGLFFLVTTGLTLLNLKLTEDKNTTDRFSKAVEMLGKENVTERLGGIYSLKKIAQDSPEYLEPIIELLAAHVREKSPKEKKEPSSAYRTPREDIRVAIKILGDPSIREPSFVISLDNIDLEGLSVNDLNLSNISFVGSNFRKSTFKNVVIRESDLSSSNFNYSHWSNVDLVDSNLSKSSLARINIVNSRIRNVNFESVTLREATISSNKKWEDLKGLESVWPLSYNVYKLFSSWNYKLHHIFNDSSYLHCLELAENGMLESYHADYMSQVEHTAKYPDLDY